MMCWQTLEMYQMKAGFSPNDPIAAHSRRRYRLTPSKFQNPGGPQPDPSLWIIHYMPAEAHDRIPSNVIPITMQIQQTMNTRAYLQSHGQIVHKEFMLHDRTNWPQIAFPRGPPRQPVYGAQAPQARIPQTMAYPTQHVTPGPPAKRVRTQTNTAPGPASVLEMDDEEDTSRGDLFDHTTPREISLARYKQNHEWMEEILSSPYSIHRIIPADLGLGVRGELAELTDGTFDAPYDPEKDVVKYSYVGRLDPGKAEEFRKRAGEHIANTEQEMEKIKAKHARRMARFKKGSLLGKAEKELRTAVSDPADVGPEYWRLEGRIEEDPSGEDSAPAVQPPKTSVDDIIAKVEAQLGLHAQQVKEILRIQDGGFEEPQQQVHIPTPRISPPGSHNGSNGGSNGSGVMVGDQDIDMSNSAGGLLDQYSRTPGALSRTNTPGGLSGFPTPQAHFQAGSSANTPSNLNNVSTPQAGGREAESTVPAQGTAGDWVVVPPGGVSPVDGSSTFTNPAQGQPLGTQNLATGQSSTPQGQTNPSPLPTTTAPTSSINTPAGGLDFHGSPNDFPDLGDLDSAGDALAGYSPQEIDGDMGEQGDVMEEVDGDGGLGDLGDLGDIEGMEGMDMDMGGGDMGGEESAFGEAFHGLDVDVDLPTPGEGGDGM